MHSVNEKARNSASHKKRLLLQIGGKKKGALFSLIYFLRRSTYITFCIIMPFRNSCHMPFRKLMPPFTLTALNTKRTYKREAEVFSLSITNPKGCRWKHLIGSLTRPNGTCFRVEHSRITSKISSR